MTTNAIIEKEQETRKPSNEDILRISLEDIDLEFDDEEVSSHAFWINDLLFKVPPENITAQSENMLGGWQALRSESTAKIYIGESNKYFTVNFYVPSKSAIVNVDKRRQQFHGQDNTGKRGGILDLIIQFKNVPFAYIENGVIRSMLNISPDKSIAISLHSLAVNTLPGHPDTLQCTLMFTPLNYAPLSKSWGYKDDWVGNERFSINGRRVTFDMVNPYELETHVPYRLTAEEFTRATANQLVTSLNPLTQWTRMVNSEMAREFNTIINPPILVADSDDGDEAADILFNQKMTMSYNQFHDQESFYMVRPDFVKRPMESNIYKEYIDWLHYKWQERHKNKLGRYGCTGISPYGHKNHNIGNELIFEWDEYEEFPLPDEIAEEINDKVQKQLRMHLRGAGDIQEPESLSSEVIGSVEEDLPKYREWIRAIESEGWVHYKGNVTMINVFSYKRRLNIQCNSSVSKTRDSFDEIARGPAICNFIGINMFNMIATLPMNGEPTPSGQFMGTTDDSLVIGLMCVGLNNVKIFRSLRDNLRAQGYKWKNIPGCWNVRLINPLINSTGKVEFAINAVDESTIPGNPDLYSIELRVVSNPERKQESTVSYIGSTNLQDLRRNFIHDLIESNFLQREDLPRVNNVKNDNELRRIVGPIEPLEIARFANRSSFIVKPNEELIESQLSMQSGNLNQFKDFLRKICYSLNSANHLLPMLPVTDNNGNRKHMHSYIETMGLSLDAEQDVSGVNYPADWRPLLDRAGIPSLYGLWSPLYNLVFNYAGRGLFNSRSRFIERYRGNFIEFWNINPNEIADYPSTPTWASTNGGWVNQDVNRISGTSPQADQLGSLINRMNGIGSGRDSLARMTDNLFNNQIRYRDALLNFRRAVPDGTFALSAIDRFKAEQFNIEFSRYNTQRLNADSLQASLISITNYIAFCTNRYSVTGIGIWKPRLVNGAPVYTLDAIPSLNPRGREAIRQSVLEVNYDFILVGGAGGGIRSRPGTRSDLELTSAYQGLNRFIRNGNLSVPQSTTNAIVNNLRETSYLEFLTIGRSIDRDAMGQLPGQRQLTNNDLIELERSISQNVIMPYLITAFNPEDIQRYGQIKNSSGDFIFRRTAEYIKDSIDLSSGAAYKDLLLPLHPIWNQEDFNSPEAINIYTQPDFFMYNWGFEGHGEIIDLGGSIAALNEEQQEELIIDEEEDFS